jgi:hypothetical protein
MKVLDKAVYQRRIWTYKKRKERLSARLNSMMGKIRLWQAALDKINSKEDFLKKLVKEINEYFNVDIRSRSQKQDIILARSVYYKIAIEKGIKGTFASTFINRTKSYGSKDRMKFTRTLEKKQSNRDAFYNFKKYFETNGNDYTKKQP